MNNNTTIKKEEILKEFKRNPLYNTQERLRDALDSIIATAREETLAKLEGIMHENYYEHNEIVIDKEEWKKLKQSPSVEREEEKPLHSVYEDVGLMRAITSCNCPIGKDHSTSEKGSK